MCFHNSMSAKAIKVAARYGHQSDVVEIYQSILDEQYHVNAFTFPRYPIITSSDEVQVFNWGLIPFWVRSEEDATEIRKMTLNAVLDISGLITFNLTRFYKIHQFLFPTHIIRRLIFSKRFCRKQTENII